MPTYEYACKQCEERLEVVQSFSDDPLTECPSCDGGELRKVFSAAGIIFKGSGWHIKDYGDKKKSSTSTTKAPTSGDSASDGSTSDSSTSSKSSKSDSSTSKAAGAKASSSDSGSSTSSKAAASD